MVRQFLSKKSVAEFFDTSVSTVNRLLETGVLPAPHKIGGLDRWDVDTLMRAAVGAMSTKAGTAAAEREADQAAEEYVSAQRARNQEKAGRRDRQGISLHRG